MSEAAIKYRVAIDINGNAFFIKDPNGSWMVFSTVEEGNQHLLRQQNKRNSKSTKRQPISKKRRKDVYKRADYACQNPNCTYRGKAFLTVDHIIPVAKGGTNEISNLQALFEKCDNTKGDKIIPH